MPIEPYLLRALLAGMAIAAIIGPLGCFVVWRRMAYFGDSLAHSALLGIALGLLTGIGASLGIILMCALFACLLVWLQSKRILATDTLLGIMAHAALSSGMVTISALGLKLNVYDYLFGDVLSVSDADVLWIFAGAVTALFILMNLWQKLVLATLHEELAKAEGINTFLLNLCFMALMTVVIAISIRMIGVLLITSLLIIPAATARQFARSPEAMAILAAGFGMLAIIGGLYASVQWDTPSGPSIVVAATALFALLLPGMMLMQRR